MPTDGAIYSTIGGMAARYRSGYLVPGGVEHSLTQKPWRPVNVFTWNNPHPNFSHLPSSEDRAQLLDRRFRKFNASPEVVCVEYLLHRGHGVPGNSCDVGH